MLTGRLLHPGLLAALARCGHGGRVLVCDALYPQSTHAARTAERVELNLTPGTVSAQEILAVLAESVQIEEAVYMHDEDGGASEPVQEFQRVLGPHRHGGGQPVRWAGLDRHEFYASADASYVAVVVVSGEVRPYANVLLTIGVP